MERLSIPKKYETGVKFLLLLDPIAVEVIVAAMEASTDPYAKSVAQEIGGRLDRSADSVLEALNALRALYTVRAGADVLLSTFVDDVMKASSEFVEPPLDEKQHAQAVASLSALLGIQKLRQKSRKQTALISDERTFCKARFTSDIRPVTSDDPGSDPESAIVIHHLKLGYHEDQGKHKNFYLAFDAEDLKALRRLCTSSATLA
jgi:hypothetical protein